MYKYVLKYINGQLRTMHVVKEEKFPKVSWNVLFRNILSWLVRSVCRLNSVLNWARYECHRLERKTEIKQQQQQQHARLLIILARWMTRVMFENVGNSRWHQLKRISWCPGLWRHRCRRERRGTFAVLCIYFFIYSFYTVLRDRKKQGRGKYMTLIQSH